MSTKRLSIDHTHIHTLIVNANGNGNVNVNENTKSFDSVEVHPDATLQILLYAHAKNEIVSGTKSNAAVSPYRYL